MTFILFPLFGPVGEVIEGLNVVQNVEKLGSASGTPQAKVVIADCGTL